MFYLYNRNRAVSAVPVSKNVLRRYFIFNTKKPTYVYGENISADVIWGKNMKREIKKGENVKEKGRKGKEQGRLGKEKE